MECPDCKAEIGKSSYCGCGWKRSRMKDQPRGAGPSALGYPQCEWLADGMRCRYPGTCSYATNGEGPWHCSSHHGCYDPVVGAQIVQASMSYVHRSFRERMAEHLERAVAFNEAMDLNTKEERRAWLRSQIDLISKKMSRVPVQRSREPGDDDV